MRQFIFTVLVFHLYGSLARGCTVCQGPSGQLVRAGIFNEQFLENAFAITLPFLLVGIFVAVMLLRLENKHSVKGWETDHE